MPFIYKHSVSGTGRVTCKIIFIRHENRSLPITQFSQLIQEVTWLIDNSRGEVIYFLARTPALGALAEPEHYKLLKEALGKHKAPISMITLAEEPLASFHVDPEGKERADQSTITRDDVDQANDEAAAISRMARVHLVAKELPFLYLFSGDKAAILITPSFREDHKSERVTMFGVTTSDQNAINHARFLFDYVNKEYAAKDQGRLSAERLGTYTRQARDRAALR